MNSIFKKRLMELGIISAALVNVAIGLYCGGVAEAYEEDINPIVSVIEQENTLVPTSAPKISAIPSVTPTITLETTPTPTAEPTPYDPYTLSDEEAIAIGNYVYDNYIKYYMTVEGSFFQKYAGEYAKEDLINIACLFNQKYPALYADRASACSSGDLQSLITFCEDIINVGVKESDSKGKTKIFPYSVFLKEGRPEKVLLEEIERNFDAIDSGNVNDDDIYKCWGGVIQLAMNADKTFEDWNNFNTLMFYYRLRGEYYYFLGCPEAFNDLPCYIPSQYVFYNRKGTKLDLEDAFLYVSSTTKNKYAALTNDEYQAYRGCFDKILAKFNEKNIDGDNYIKQRRKNGN